MAAVTVIERTTIGSFLRATQARCAQLCQKETLDFGIAYFSERFAMMPDACQFREVWVPDASKLGEAFRESEAWFSSKHLRCLRWAPAQAQAVDRLGPFLMERGFTSRESVVMGLTRWAGFPAGEGIRVLPARAMRAAFRDTFLDSRHLCGPPSELLADAALERLDDPQLDMFVAVRGKQPVGRCGFFQVGDIALLVDLYCLPGSASIQVETALLHQVLALAKRLTMPTVLIDVPRRDRDKQARLEAVGFASAGEYTEFDRRSDS